MDALPIDELRRLRDEEPEALHRHLLETRRGFLFGVEDHRDEPEAWGGEVRVVINRNVVLHFVPRFNAAMSDKAELPQFTVFPDADRSDKVEETGLRVDDELVRGVIFWVDPTEYDELLRGVVDVLERYEDWPAIPDTYFLDGPLVPFLERVVLEHPTIVAEREYDFRRGLVGGGPAPAAAADEVEPAPDREAWEQAGATYAFGDEDEEEEDEDEGGAEDDEEEGLDDEDDAPMDEEELARELAGGGGDEAGDDEPDDDDDDDEPRGEHFRTTWGRT